MNAAPSDDLPTAEDVRRAAARIAGRVTVTPVERSDDLDEMLGCRLFFKCENRQRTGAFKLRGASHAVARLDERGMPGDVATHSSGNHGAALACAATAAGRGAWVVMPEDAVTAKVDNVRRHGGQVIFCEPNQAAREAGLERLVSERGCHPIPPYDHPDIIAGQGTAALELLEAVPDLDVIVTPVGGGGLISGTALIASGRCAVHGAEPAGAADTVNSLAAGERLPEPGDGTICDGLRALVGERNFAIIRDSVAAVHAVADEDSLEAMRWIRRHLGDWVEPSSSIALAAVAGQPEHFGGLRVGIILTGGNVDPALLERLG